jgi:hypothetical protein
MKFKSVKRIVYCYFGKEDDPRYASAFTQYGFQAIRVSVKRSVNYRVWSILYDEAMQKVDDTYGILHLNVEALFRLEIEDES